MVSRPDGRHAPRCSPRSCCARLIGTIDLQAACPYRQPVYCHPPLRVTLCPCHRGTLTPVLAPPVLSTLTVTSEGFDQGVTLRAPAAARSCRWPAGRPPRARCGIRAARTSPPDPSALGPTTGACQKVSDTLTG
eukprot:7900624-Pyramimonas_sp.AAC.2